MSRIQSVRIAGFVCLAGILLASLGPLFGDDEKPAAPAGDPAAGEKPAAAEGATDFKAEWKKLSERKLEIARTLRELEKEFNATGTTTERKREIRDEFGKLLTEFRFEIEAKMRTLADKVYNADPTDTEAAEAVMQAAFSENQYDRALDVAEKLLESGGKSKYAGNMAINIAGAASFSLNQFQQADEYFKQAKEKEQLNDELAGRFLEQLPQYMKFWKEEQEIREREAALEGGEKLPRVELTIGNGKEELGKVELELFENEAPNTVANFINIVEDEDQNYNGVKFHRVLANFMAQTGNLEASGKKPLDYTIKCECYQENARKHFRGSVSMALKGKDTGDSQFFITHTPTYWLNEEVRPESVHTVFGRVVSGMDVIDRVKQGDQIISAKVLFKRDHEYKVDKVPNPS